MNEGEPILSQRFCLGEALIYLDQAYVEGPENRHSLSRLETKILFELARQPGRTVSKQALLESVWGYNPNVQPPGRRRLTEGKGTYYS
jgi:DNA-binding response OmpR family regulator